MPVLNPANYLFMTTKPLIRRLHVAQLEWLYILPAVDIVTPTLKVLITYTDASTQAADIDLVQLRKNEVKKVNMSYAAQNYAGHVGQEGKTIKKIEVWIEPADDLITYVPWQPNTDNLKQFFYGNSLGGIDSFVCIGDGQGSYEFSGEVASLQVDDSYQTETGQEHAVNTRVRQLFTAYSGYKPKLEIKAVADMLAVNWIRKLEYFGATPKFVPVLINSQSLVLPSDLENRNSFDFQYRYAWEDRALDRV